MSQRETNASVDPSIRSAVAQYERLLTMYALRLLGGDAERARDVVQETFLRLCRHENVATLNGHLAEWLYTVCRTRALDVRRKETRMTPLAETDASQIETTDRSPADQVERDDMAARILRLIARLPDNQQEVLRLKFQHDMSYKQIAGITRLSVSNVGFLIHTGLKTIREQMNYE